MCMGGTVRVIFSQIQSCAEWMWQERVKCSWLESCRQDDRRPTGITDGTVVPLIRWDNCASCLPPPSGQNFFPSKVCNNFSFCCSQNTRCYKRSYTEISSYIEREFKKNVVISYVYNFETHAIKYNKIKHRIRKGNILFTRNTCFASLRKEKGDILFTK